MAKVRAFREMDMTDLGFEIGTVLHADSGLVVIEASIGTSYYYGNFRFPGYDWKGTITDLFHYESGNLSYYAQGMALPAKYGTVATGPDQAVRKALSGNDRVTGSHEDDILLGFVGDDTVGGGRGDDRLHGNSGDDTLLGGAGRDMLKGGGGADVLNGGAGADRLTGGAGADRFEFGRTARDTVRDFQNGTDRIVIRDGADDIGDLTLRNRDGHAIVTYADAKLVLEDLWIGRLDAGDFVFA